MVSTTVSSFWFCFKHGTLRSWIVPDLRLVVMLFHGEHMNYVLPLYTLFLPSLACSDIQGNFNIVYLMTLTWKVFNQMGLAISGLPDQVVVRLVGFPGSRLYLTNKYRWSNKCNSVHFSYFFFPLKALVRYLPNYFVFFSARPLRFCTSVSLVVRPHKG